MTIYRKLRTGQKKKILIKYMSLLRIGLSPKQAIFRVGMSKTSIYRWQRRFKGVPQIPK